MMKSKYILAWAAASLAVFSGCEDLDTLPQGSTVTTTQKEEIVESKPERAKAGVTAIFSQFSVYAPNYTAFGGLRHNDIGYPAIMMATDANGQDVVMDNNGYNWAGSSLRYSDRTYTSYESQMVWNDLYKIIFNANNVVAIPVTEELESQFALAQGLSVRAFGYLTLAQLYQFNYKGHEESPCVPIITNENSGDAALNGAPRASVKEVYAQVKSDLDAAIDVLAKAEEGGYTRDDKRYIDLATAYGLRARMNLAMHNYADAAADATKAIESSDAVPSALEAAGQPAFWSTSEKNWMWGIIINETDDVVSSGIVNWISHNGTFNYGYCWYSGGHQISKKLYNTIADTDVRKAWWSDGEGKNPALTPAYQEFLEDYGYAPYTSCKFAPYGGYSDTNLGAETNANDIPLMRIEEMYLIKAEGEAMANGNTNALADFIKTYRDPAYTVPAGDIQDEILRQRRIELWGEGLVWYDFMRLNKGIDRRGAGYPNAPMVFNIPAGSDLLLWRLPETEIQANVALSEADNNPVAPSPQPVPDVE